MDFTPPREEWPRRLWDQPVQRLFSDDPADHGLSEAEVACIEKAYEIRRREVGSALSQRRRSSSTGGCPDPSGRRP